MEIQEYIDKVETSETYKSWIDKNPDYYLVHLFSMTGSVPQVGYYSGEEDKIVTFVLDSEIRQNPAEESFKKEGAIPRLILDDVRIDISKAAGTASDLNKKEYMGENIDKQLMILQTLDGRPVYNVTLITSSFHYVNVKIDAADGSIIDHSRNSILDLKKQ